MAEATAPAPEAIEPTTVDAAAVDMVAENAEPACVDSAADGESNQKRDREDDEEEEEGVSKKPKVDVKLGPKSFNSSKEMFDYFYNFLHAWPLSVNLNKYEHMVVLDLLKNGHSEPDNKIGGGVLAFQVRKHPMWKSRCFFLIREDESMDDFSFRKCVNHILPLPIEMQLTSKVNGSFGGPGGRGRGRGRGGRGRG